MKCFNHADRDAIGVCKSCGKGICHECLVTSPQGVVCKDDNCGRIAKLFDRAVEGNLAMLTTFRRERKSQGFTLIFMGLLMVGYGLLALKLNSVGSFFPMVPIGAVLVLLGGAVLRRLARQTTESSEAK